ncbi:MAG: isoprenylcysteine carboxylmethyltransferase family protein [Anaerolineales bacterium]
MEFLPDFRLGWLNGWLLLGLLVLTDGVLFLAFRKNTVERLFDRSGWSKWQIVITVIGKLLALVTVLIIIFTPLKLGSYVFIIGTMLVGVGLIVLVKALLDFRNSDSDQPVTQGIYRLTRHPQNLASSMVILGCTIAIGSWLALILFVVARILLHANLVAEEEVCLREYGDAYRDYMNKVPRYLFFS